MNLIDWPSVARNALWILGLSIAVATWSYISWWASARRVRVRQALGWPLFQVPFSYGMTLFAASLAWGATRWWERGLWIVLALAFLWQAIMLGRYALAHGWEAERAPQGKASHAAPKNQEMETSDRPADEQLPT